MFSSKVKMHVPHSISTAPTLLARPKLQLLCRPRRRVALASGNNNSSTEGSNSTSATASSNDKTSTEDLACYGVGAEVECVVPEYETNSTSNGNGSSTSSPKERSNVAPFIDTLLLISPFFFWGTSMVAMKQLGPHTTPLFLAAWRLIPAGVVLLLWAQATGRKQPNSSMAWLAVALFGIADGTMFQGFLAEGLQRTSAGLGSVIIDSQPLTVAVLASLFFGERLGKLGVLGLGMGVAGLLLLEVPPEVLSTGFLDTLVATTSSITSSGTVDLAAIATSTTSSSSSSSAWSIWDSGEWWMLLAAQSMAVGTVMVRWVAKYCDPVIATGWHMILGGIPLTILALVQDGGELSTRLSDITASDVGLLVYVSLLGSAASYGVFFYEATVRGNLTALSSLTFLTPMFAAAGGYVALGETLTPLQLFGATVTLGAVTLLNSGGGDGDEKSEKKTE
jgi:drug/metabolite transporter (DMT)-like permease